MGGFESGGQAISLRRARLRLVGWTNHHTGAHITAWAREEAVGDLRRLVFAQATILAAVPLALVGGLSGFRPGSASYYQRVWIMTWLVFGIFAGPAIHSARSVLDTWKVIDAGMVYSAPAIGGLVVVGQMIRDHGVCTELRG